MKRRLPLILVGAGAGLVALANLPVDQGFTETFDGGSNEGGWTFGTVDEYIRPTGGNPGAFLYAPWFDDFAPQPRTEWGAQSVFTGDWRARRINGVGIDLICLGVQSSTADRPLSLILVHDNDSPGDFTDDWGVYFVGNENIPDVDDGWKRFYFGIPYDSPSLPSGWRRIQFGANAPIGDWNDIIRDVKQVRFFFGDPQMGFIYQLWELGLDNPALTYAPQAPTPLTAMVLLDGEVISGGLDDLRTSDDAYLEMEARVTGEVHQPHLLRLRITAEPAQQNVTEITLRIEGRITDVESQTTLLLRNWQTGQFEQVDRYNMAFSEAVHEVTIADASRFIRASDGRIRLEIEQIVFFPFTLNGFHTLLDHVEIVAQ